MDRLHNRVKRVLVESVELDLDPAEIASDARLHDEIGLDSAALLDLVAALEEAFGIEIETEEITQERFESIDSLARFVAEKT